MQRSLENSPPVTSPWAETGLAAIGCGLHLLTSAKAGQAPRRPATSRPASRSLGDKQLSRDQHCSADQVKQSHGQLPNKLSITQRCLGLHRAAAHPRAARAGNVTASACQAPDFPHAEINSFGWKTEAD